MLFLLCDIIITFPFFYFYYRREYLLGRALSVKCSDHTLDNLRRLFKEDARFIELGNYGVMLNPSWFFKFSANYTLDNFTINEEMKKYAYESHYVDFLDKKIKKGLKDYL